MNFLKKEIKYVMITSVGFILFSACVDSNLSSKSTEQPTFNPEQNSENSITLTPLTNMDCGSQLLEESWFSCGVDSSTIKISDYTISKRAGNTCNFLIENQDKLRLQGTPKTSDIGSCILSYNIIHKASGQEVAKRYLPLSVAPISMLNDLECSSKATSGIWYNCGINLSTINVQDYTISKRAGNTCNFLIENQDKLRLQGTPKSADVGSCILSYNVIHKASGKEVAKRYLALEIQQEVIPTPTPIPTLINNNCSQELMTGSYYQCGVNLSGVLVSEYTIEKRTEDSCDFLALNQSQLRVQGTPKTSDVGNCILSYRIIHNQSLTVVAQNNLTLTINALSPVTSLDPQGCNNLTYEQLRFYGYEPVMGNGAKGDNMTDDTTAIQNTINTARNKRRVVYFHPGTYLVSKTLEMKQEISETENNGAQERYGNVLVGSYCGNEKPTIRLKDGVAPQTNEKIIGTEPFPVLLVWRDMPGATGPDDSEGGRDWNQIVRNLKIVTGNNPGAVGLRHRGAEGSSAQELIIDATGGFAGLYNLNSSGGYTYNVEVIGGKYGIYFDEGGGGSTMILGAKLHGQSKTPIAYKDYTPMILIGFDITHDDGNIMTIVKSDGTITNDLRSTYHDTSGHLSLVDGSITITGPAPSILTNTDRSVYMKNVYVKGSQNILVNSGAGSLTASDPNQWSYISEYAYSGNYLNLFGEESKLIKGIKTDQTYDKGILKSANTQINITSTVTSLPSDLQSKHLYPLALCNVENKNTIFVTDHGASPNDTLEDSTGIQKAIDAAIASGFNKVFLPAGQADNAKLISNKYKITKTLKLGAKTVLCGVSRHSSILNTNAWSPNVNSPVIEAPNDSIATTTIADFKIELRTVEGKLKTGFLPHVYAINWQAGKNSIYRDVYYQLAWGNPGDRTSVIITNNGGGRWYGVTQHGGFLPGTSSDRSFLTNGELTMSSQARHMLIQNNKGSLTFYPFHLQHMTVPYGAQAELINASHVTIYSSKSEMGSVPEHMEDIIEDNPPEMVPIWIRIKDSNNINFISYEGLVEESIGRGVIEIENSTNITIANMGRRGNGLSPSGVIYPQDKWYFILDEGSSGPVTHVTAQGFLSLFKN